MRSTVFSVVALVGLGLASVTVPAAAAPVNGALPKSLASGAYGDSGIIQIQHRRGSRGDRHDRRRGDDGGAVAAGILGGLLLGAIIANQAQQQRSVEYCIRRYRSYDPYSRTYVGYDGRRHRCP